MITGTVVLSGIAVGLAVALVLCGRYLAPVQDDVVDKVERILPRIQCAQCGYPGCRPYAAAIVAGSAPLNLCPPGGEDTVRRLARFLGREPPPLSRQPSAVGVNTAEANLDEVAVIDEAMCIGCNLCARVCPVDAIVGVQQMMHTVISEHCTGCTLCLAPCPVDCIALAPHRA